MIPSSRRSILAASSAQRSLCLAGERAELDVRPSEPACPSERGRKGRREERREEGRGGRVLRSEGPGLAPRPPAHPARRPPREGSSRPRHPRPTVRRARLRPNICFWNKTSGTHDARRSHPGRRGFSRVPSRGRSAPPPTWGFRGQPNEEKGGGGREVALARGVELWVSGRGPDFCERPGDTSG